MKKVMLAIFIVSIFISGLVSSGQAVYFDFSALGFVNGQNLEGAVLNGATFTSETGDLRYFSDYGGGIGTGFIWGAAADTYIAFSQPVSGLSFTAGDGGGDNDAFAVSLYEFGTDNFLGTFNSPVFGGPNEPEWYTLNIAAANVGRVVFDPGNSGALPGVKELLGGVVITEMGYVTAPLPGALWLFGSALLGLGLWRRQSH